MVWAYGLLTPGYANDQDTIGDLGVESGWIGITRQGKTAPKTVANGRQTVMVFDSLIHHAFALGADGQDTRFNAQLHIVTR